MNDHKGRVVVSDEKQFIYHDSVNRGHVQLPQMVIKCRNLSDTAKIIYGVISGYVFEYGRSAFPSVSRIAMCSNCSKKTAIKYIDELVDKGFITKERHGNRRTNTYYFVDADKVAHLHVSEMFWRVFNDLYSEVDPKLYDAVYDGVMELSADMEREGKVFSDIPVNAETEKGIKDYLLSYISKESESMFKPPNRNKEKPDVDKVPTPSAALDIQPPVLSGGTGRFGMPEDVQKWKNDSFVQYFYEKHIDATDKTHEAARSKHRGMFGRVIANCGGDKLKVKRLVDAFFEIGYDIKSLEWFCTSGRMAELELYLTTGKKPYYIAAKDKKEAVESATQDSSGMSPEAFLNRIKLSN